MGWGHVYVTAHGEWSSGHWQGETGQIGVRVSAWDNPNFISGPMPNYTGHSPRFDQGDSTLFLETVMFDADVAAGAGFGDNAQRDLATDMHTFLGTIRALQHNAFRWTHVKIALIERGTGKYLYPSSIFEFKSPLAGLQTDAEPPEVSLCLSNRTAIVGRRGRGRVYLPAIGRTVVENINGTAKATSQDSAATAFQQLHADMANTPGIDLFNSGIVITSAKSTQMVVPREVRVGKHMDVQRRRQWQVQETYVTKSV